MKETKTRKIAFTYDPLNLMKICLQRFVEKFVEGNYYEAKQYACYKLLNELTEEELYEYLEQYRKKHNVEFITLENWEEETKMIWEVIYENDKYKTLETHYKKKGHGITGLGVVYIPDDSFYDCEFTGHWTKLKEVLQKKNPEYGEALIEMEFNDKLDEYNGISRQAVDRYILRNFELIGANRSIQNYL